MSEFNPHLAKIAVHYIKEERYEKFPYLPAEPARALLPYIFIPDAEDKEPEKSMDVAKTEAMFRAALREEGSPVFGKAPLRDYMWMHVPLEALVRFEAMIRADCAAKGEKK